MRISYNWLKDYIDTNLTVEEAAEIITNTGLEVDEIEKTGGLTLPDGLITGLVTSVVKHPDADKLSICKVDCGKNEELQIVCGASNVAIGQKVPVATIGTILTPFRGESFKIKQSKIRGIESSGMICAEDEIGLSEDHHGIMILPEETAIGIPFKDLYVSSEESSLEVAITANRNDAISHIGVARDLAAKIGKKVIYPQVDPFKIDKNETNFSVEIEIPELCPRYSGIVLKGIAVKESPEWLKKKLRSIGINPTNNVVDVTNFVLHETGQPLHAFDLEELEGEKIIVKRMPSGYKFATLDGTEKALNGEEIMICDAVKPVAMGGVMGGMNSMVSDKTKSIFIESAFFNPSSIRKTARFHGYSTDASYRFERGTDPNITVFALKRAANLIKELSGGYIASEIIDVYPNPIREVDINLPFSLVNKIIGNDIESKIVISVLESLEYKIIESTDKYILVSVPTYRADVIRPVDLIEDFLRIYSFDKVNFSETTFGPLPQVKIETKTNLQNKLSQYLVSSGFYELLTHSFLSSSKKDTFVDDHDFTPVKTLNAVNHNLDTLRNSYLFSGLESLSYNYKRNNYNLKFYEFGRIYGQKKSGEFSERDQIAIWICGNIYEQSWFAKEQKADYFYLKGLILNLLKLSGVKGNISERKIEDNRFDLFTELTQGKKVFARFGVVSSQIASNLDIRDEVFYAEIEFNDIAEIYCKASVKHSSPPKFPAVIRDLSMLLQKDISYLQIKNVVYSLKIGLLKQLSLIDVYEGKNIEPGFKSYAIRLKFQDENETLRDEKIDIFVTQIINALEHDLKAIIRK